MLEIDGNKYMSVKEASRKFGMSYNWFYLRRVFGGGPEFIQLTEKGRVYYPLDALNKWFKCRLNAN